MKVESLTKHITLEKMQSYMGNVKDNIHTDPNAAKAWGVGGALVQGGQLVSFLNELLWRNFGAGYQNGGEISVSFIKAVRPGDTVTVRSEQTGEIELDGKRRVELDVWIENQNGDKVTVGKASAVVG